MKRKLKSIAMQLSEEDIQAIIKLKKSGGRRAETLRKKRDKLLAQVADIDAEIARLTGEAPSDSPRRSRGAPRGAKRGRVNFVAKMREVFQQAEGPLRAREVVDALPSVGVKVKDIPYTRKRVSVALATNKCFSQVSRGVYQLNEEEQ